MEVGQDFREIFIQEVLDHLQAIGRTGQNVCFVEPKYADQGTDEQEVLAEYYRRRHGLTIVHADPAELYIEGRGGLLRRLPRRHRLSRLRNPRPGRTRSEPKG